MSKPEVETGSQPIDKVLLLEFYIIWSAFILFQFEIIGRQAKWFETKISKFFHPFHHFRLHFLIFRFHKRRQTYQG